MSPNQNYLLSGIQKSPSPKNYIITNRGIEVVGEQEITPVTAFLDTVIQYANEPSRKIIVLKELLKHLQKMNEMTPNNPWTIHAHNIGNWKLATLSLDPDSRIERQLDDVLKFRGIPIELVKYFSNFTIKLGIEKLYNYIIVWFSSHQYNFLQGIYSIW